MSSTALYALGSVLLVSMIPVLGVLFLCVREKLVRRSILFLVSFSTGALLGDVFIHMIPEMQTGAGFQRDMYVILFGIVASFVFEKVIHWRHCHILPDGPHDHSHVHPMGPLNLIGDTIHNFIDGLIIAASYVVSIPVGISTTLAVVLHEIPLEVGNFAVLLHSGYSRKKAILFNIYAQIAGIVAVVLFLLAGNFVTTLAQYMLPLAAGNFIYIAGSDLIPELHKETGLRHVFIQLFAMTLGIFLMLLITFLE